MSAICHKLSLDLPLADSHLTSCFVLLCISLTLYYDEQKYLHILDEERYSFLFPGLLIVAQNQHLETSFAAISTATCKAS